MLTLICFSIRCSGRTNAEGTPSRYAIGADLCAPFAVTLTIRAPVVTIEQIRSDLPHIVDKLEIYIIATQAEVARATA